MCVSSPLINGLIVQLVIVLVVYRANVGNYFLTWSL